MRIFAIIICLILPLFGVAQNQTDVEFMEVFTEVDTMPSYKGGDVELLKFLNTNSSLKFIKERNHKKYVSLSFIIAKDGKVYNPKVLVSSGKEIEQEVIRVLLTTMWNPGIRKGKKVNVLMSRVINIE